MSYSLGSIGSAGSVGSATSGELVSLLGDAEVCAELAALLSDVKAWVIPEAILSVMVLK